MLVLCGHPPRYRGCVKSFIYWVSAMKNEKMSDFEITVYLASLLYPECNHAHTVKEHENGDVEFWCSDPIGNTVSAGKHNYCNSWADMGPLIEKHKIELSYDGAFKYEWEASHIVHVSQYDVDVIGMNENKNPLRSAAICLIKILESKK